MSKGAKTFIYVLLAIIAGLIIYVLVGVKKQVGGPPPAEKKKQDSNNTNTTTDKTDAGKAGIDTTTTPPTTVNDANIGLDKQVYAGEDILNVYKSCSPSASNIYATFNKGDLIGNFIAKEGNCIKVAIPTYLTAFLIGAWESSADGYIPFNAKIYYK